MSESNYEAVSRSPNHKWTLEQRVTLCTLIDLYEVTWVGARKIFNALFADELPSSTGLTSGALFSMRHQSRQNGWIYTGQWNSIRAAIEAKAFELGIHLPPKALPEGVIVFQELARNKSKVSSSIFEAEPRVLDDLGSADESSDTLIGDDYEEPVTPCKSRGRRPPTLTIPGLMTSCPYTPLPGKGAQTWKGTPRLVFRAYCEDSQGTNSLSHFRAGNFVETATIPDSPDPKSEYYRKEAARHIQKAHSGPTPFISVTESLLRVYKIASKMGTTSKIAILDLHEAIGHRELAQCNPVQSLDLQQYTREWYTGSGEWLIWGATSAIVGTASLADMDSLPTISGHDDPVSFETIRASKGTIHARIQISRERAPCTFQIGRAISQLAKVFQLPRKLLSDFVGCVVNDFKLEHRGPWNKNRAFIDGINFGFEENMISDPALENQSLDSFVDSLYHYLESAESSQSIKTAMTTPFNSIELVSSEDSERKPKLVRKIPPTLSMSSQGDKRIKREPMDEGFYLSGRSVKQSGEVKREASSLITPDHEWRTVEGWGPFVLAYKPCGL